MNEISILSVDYILIGYYYIIKQVKGAVGDEVP